ncbi:hypothetical protein QQF64_034053 [Cirrhinus molitorella]|uniref:SET domain-containing protein n=1 Tax=Cirrhinus molitorella TaxID=172907 RepID=A0ABR3MVW9_9TELE
MGELINQEELERRRKLYHPSCGVFMFEFKWRGKTWCIDASREDGSFGRIVNDDHQHPNCKMKKIDVNGKKPNLCLFATERYYKKEEENCKSRSAANIRAADDSEPSLQSETQMDDALGQARRAAVLLISEQQMTLNLLSSRKRSGEMVMLLVSSRSYNSYVTFITEDKSCSAANIRAADDSEPSLQSETQMDDALGQARSSQQKSRSADNIEQQMTLTFSPVRKTQRWCCSWPKQKSRGANIRSSRRLLNLLSRSERGWMMLLANAQKSRSAANIRAADDSEPSLCRKRRWMIALVKTGLLNRRAAVLLISEQQMNLNLSILSETQMEDALGQAVGTLMDDDHGQARSYCNRRAAVLLISVASRQMTPLKPSLQSETQYGCMLLAKQVRSKQSFKMYTSRRSTMDFQSLVDGVRLVCGVRRAAVLLRSELQMTLNLSIQRKRDGMMLLVKPEHREEQLANFLGHDIRIHREFYRLPEKTLQLAKISKVLMALEQGRLAEFHGKNLDEIGIDPDGKTTQKRTPWQQTEVQAVERHLKRFIISGTVPAKSDCEKCLRAEPEALRNKRLD